MLAELERYSLYKKQLALVEQGKRRQETENDTNRLLRLDASVSRMRFYTQAVEETLNILPETRRRFIELRCIQGLSDRQVESEIFVVPSTQRTWLSNILPLFATRMGL